MARKQGLARCQSEILRYLAEYGEERFICIVRILSSPPQSFAPVDILDSVRALLNRHFLVAFERPGLAESPVELQAEDAARKMAKIAADEDLATHNEGVGAYPELCLEATEEGKRFLQVT